MTPAELRKRADECENNPHGAGNGCEWAADEIERLDAEIEEWRSCARYDPMMEGPRFKGWDRSQMDRCRKRFLESGK